MTNLIQSLLAAALATAFAAPAAAQPAATRSPSTGCESLSALRLPDVRITEAKAVAGDDSTAAHCRVVGVIGKEIKFLALLPTGWNGRFVMSGGGGFVGSIALQVNKVRDGYVTAGTDTGHEGSGISARWALDEVERQVDFGHVAVHRTAEVVKAIIRAYYGADPEKSYFSGCSNGGRQALMEAQRYPDDFDGIISGAPAFNFTTIGASFIKNIRAAFPSGPTHPVVRPAALRLLEASVLAACDAKDGVKDGTMEDPRLCGFSLASLKACPAGKPGPDCLTGAERAAIQTIISPLRDAKGIRYPGQPFGGESLGGGWDDWITGGGGMMQALGNSGPPSAQFAFGTEMFKYLIFNDSTWDYRTYPIANARRDAKLAASFLDAESPDLGRFAARGGKLILWHGWSDAALNALATIDYAAKVRKATPGFEEQLRLFLLPGVLHCGGGSGPDQVDWVSVMDDWTRTGKAPDRVIATKLGDDDKPARTRPLCAYPERAVYRGTGSTDDESSFACRAPGSDR
jgi:feruloyl esterase